MSGFNFSNMLIEKGHFLKNEDGTPSVDGAGKKSVDIGTAADAMGLGYGSLNKFLEGWSNPLRGKTFSSIRDYLGLEEPKLKAFLRWRADKWNAWEEAGALYEGDVGFSTSRDTWDEEKDYKDEYLAEEMAYFSANEVDEEEVPSEEAPEVPESDEDFSSEEEVEETESEEEEESDEGLGDESEEDEDFNLS